MATTPEFIIPTQASEARAIQDALCSRLKLYDDFGPVKRIAGVDVTAAYSPQLL